MHIDKHQLQSNNDRELWQIISELAASSISIEDTRAHYKRLKELTEDPLLSLHPKIGYIKDKLALEPPPVAGGGAPVAAVRQADIDIHDKRLSGSRKDAQDFLDKKHPLETVTQEVFRDTINDIKHYIATNNTYPETELSGGERDIIEIPENIKEILPEYLDFLVEDNAGKQQYNLTNPGVKVICQIWALCKADNPVITYKDFFDMLHEAATVYKESTQKFWLNPGRDYTCHVGLEERLQTMTAQISASLISDAEKSYGQLLSEYVMQSFALLSNSETGRESIITINEKAIHMIHGIALELITPKTFEEKQYTRPMYQKEFNSYYQLEGGVFKLKDEHHEKGYPLSISAEGVDDTKVRKDIWFVRNKAGLPQVQDSIQDYAEGSLETLSNQVLGRLYEDLGVDSWLIGLVFTDIECLDSHEALRAHIKEHLRNERELLQAKEPLDTSPGFVQFDTSAEKDSLKQAFKKIAEAFIHNIDVDLFTPLSTQENAWLQEELIARFLPDRNADNSQLLLNAVESNNLAHCRAILAITELPAEVLTKQDRLGMNALMVAIAEGHTEIATAILDRPNLPDTVLTAHNSDHMNVLMYAINGSHRDIANAILSRPNLPDSVLTHKNKHGLSIIIQTLLGDETEIATLILSRDKLPDQVLTDKDSSNMNVLMWALARGRRSIHIASTILARKNLPLEVLTAKDPSGKNALMSTIHLWHPNIASTILAREDLPDEVLTNEDDDGRNTLTLAISRGYTELVSTVASQLINRNLLTLSNRIALFFSGYFKLPFSSNKLVIDNSRMHPAGSATEASTPEPVVGSKQGVVNKNPNHTREGPE